MNKIFDIEQKNGARLQKLEDMIKKNFSEVIDAITSLKEQKLALSEVDHDNKKEKKIDPFKV